MAEQTQTEKLRGRIGQIFTWVITDAISPKDAEALILKVCKEAGLVFADYSTDDKGNIIIQGLGEIEI